MNPFREKKVCAQCGYTIDDADEDYYIVKETGEAIHIDCWADYSQEHAELFCKEVNYDE